MLITSTLPQSQCHLKAKRLSQSKGFSLIEVLIVIAIVGILAAVALPSYQDSVRKGNRSDGQAALLEAASRMERFFYDNNTYTTNLTNIGYGAEKDVATSEGHYELSVAGATAACPIATCFSLSAVAVNAQVKDGNLTLNSLGQKIPADKW